MSNSLEVRVKGGVIRAVTIEDPEYPGIHLEFIADDDKGETPSRFSCRMEKPASSLTLARILVWADSSEEDFTDQIYPININDLIYDECNRYVEDAYSFKELPEDTNCDVWVREMEELIHNELNYLDTIKIQQEAQEDIYDTIREYVIWAFAEIIKKEVK